MSPKKKEQVVEIVSNDAPSWTNIQVTLAQLKPWSLNPKFSTKSQAKKILESWTKFGQVLAVAVGPDYDVYDGHQRLSALNTLYGSDYTIDARQSNRPLTDDERKGLIITLHAGATGSWDWNALGSWKAEDLKSWGLDKAALSGWKDDAIALNHVFNEFQFKPRQVLEDLEIELPGDAVGGNNSPLGLRADVFFPSTNLLGFPDINPNLICTLPRKMDVWTEADNYAQTHYLAIHSYRSTRYLNKANALLGFYTHDEKLEELWVNIAVFTERRLTEGWKGLLTVNFSTYPHQPKIVNQYQVYRQRFTGAYWQSVGINIVPDIDWAILEDFDWLLEGLPVGLPSLAVQVNTQAHDDTQARNRREGLVMMVERLKPEALLVYGANSYWEAECKRVLSSKTRLLFVPQFNIRSKDLLKEAKSHGQLKPKPAREDVRTQSGSGGESKES